MKQARLSEAEIGEIVAHVAINVLTNYFNIAMETEIDFPVVNVSNVQRLRFALLKQQLRQLG